MPQLTQCKACNQQISTSAEVCPSCGHPIKKDRDNKNSMIQIVLLLGVVLIILALQKYGYLDLGAIMKNIFNSGK